MDGWLERMDEWMNEWMDGWMDEWMDGLSAGRTILGRFFSQ